MNSFVSTLIGLTLASGLLAQAQAAPERLSSRPQQLLAADIGDNRNNPTNSPIRRANPNSRQGSEPATPPVRGPSTAPVIRPSTIENGAIGNGYPRSQPQPRPINPGTQRQNPSDQR